MDHPTTADPIDLELTRVSSQREHLRTRHSQALARLMEERDDLRGVNALADLVSDSLRWSA